MLESERYNNYNFNDQIKHCSRLRSKIGMFDFPPFWRNHIDFSSGRVSIDTLPEWLERVSRPLKFEFHL